MLSVKYSTPQGVLFSGDAKYVNVPTLSGSIGIYPMHQPNLSLLDKGNVKIIDKDNKEHKWTIESADGFLCVDNDIVSIVNS